MTILERSGLRIVLRIESSLYSEDVIFKCFYWYGDKFDVEISKADDDAMLVSLSIKDGSMSEDYLDALDSKVKRDLIDFKTRDIVSKETKVVRELLIAKAFAHSDEFDRPPPGDVSDPLGFEPEDYARRETNTEVQEG